jgi:AraC family transcriptional regulator of adaptative response/methylated-DNA-[protein]-cysteine methyltransferase
LKPMDRRNGSRDGEERVTPFQRRVYQAIRRIPKGQVRSYAWVAQAIGQPKATRAVGQALKRNRWPDQIPCHRVIASDGSLGGYAWGEAAKCQRLAREGIRVKKCESCKVA